MKKKSLTKAIALLTASIFSLTYFFLIPLARIQYSQAQDGGVLPPKPAQPKTVSRIHIPTMANSTVMKTSEGEQALLIQDHLTSTRVIEMGGQGKNQEYYPYGTTRGEPNAVTDKQFTSHRSIADTGVYHAGARFYNPQLGVFVSADKVQGPNRYMYAMSNPALHTDPSGKIVPIIIAAIIIGGAAFGAGFGTGYEQQSQVNQYGSVQDPTKVVMAGVGGAAVGAGAGYMGAVAVPAAIGAVSAGAAASTSVGLVGGAQIGVGSCLMSASCIDAIEMGAQMASGSDLPSTYRISPLSSLDGASSGPMMADDGAMIFRKLAFGATEVHIDGQVLNAGGRAEFDVLGALYHAAPDSVVQPVGLITHMDEVIGYDARLVNGETIPKTYFPDWNDQYVPRNVVEQARDFIMRIHSQGLAHGDFNMNNIMVDGSGRMIVIDPVGYDMGDLDMVAKMQARDLDRLATLEKYAR